MLDIAALQAAFPTLATLHSSSLAKPKRAAAVPQHPRNNVIALIENSIQLLADPAYRIQQKRTKKEIEPETCYKINGDGTAHISLTYSKQKLTIDNGKDIISVPAAALPQVLEKIKSQVANGVLDTQVSNIHSQRSNLMKQNIAVKKAAGQLSKKAA